MYVVSHRSSCHVVPFYEKKNFVTWIFCLYRIIMFTSPIWMLMLTMKFYNFIYTRSQNHHINVKRHKSLNGHRYTTPTGNDDKSKDYFFVMFILNFSLYVLNRKWNAMKRKYMLMLRFGWTLVGLLMIDFDVRLGDWWIRSLVSGTSRI